MARILLAEDDSSVSDLIVDFLQIQHEVVVVKDGAAAYDHLATNSFQIAVLDWDMPKMTGFEVCKKYRDAGGTAPILMLTGRTEIEDKEAGLDAGADDYLTKPFLIKELAARIRSMLRRGASGSDGRFEPSVSSLRVCTSCGSQYSATDAQHEICPLDGSITVVVSADRLIGSLVASKYRIKSLLGVGAWSEVYRATDMSTGSDVAIKILHVHLAADPLKVTRFNREADTLLRLEHRCFAKVYTQSKLDSGRPCLVMEFLDGMDLDKFLTNNGPMTVKQAQEIFLPICEALASAHDLGLIHRDLKPSNIFLIRGEEGWSPKILDFGLAKSSVPLAGVASLTGSGEVLGTPAYMSPEQCLGEKLDTRSDLYSLGCLVYECLTGKRAIPGKSAFDAMSNQLSRIPDPMTVTHPGCNVSEQIEATVFKLLAKEPDDRFKDVGEFARRFQDDSP